MTTERQKQTRFAIELALSTGKNEVYGYKFENTVSLIIAASSTAAKKVFLEENPEKNPIIKTIETILLDGVFVRK